MPPPDPSLCDLRPVSLKPPDAPALRDAARLIAMVHELHKADYPLDPEDLRRWTPPPPAAEAGRDER